MSRQTYLGNGHHKWEPVTEETSRLRVPGGWLYTAWSTQLKTQSTVFVPLPAALVGRDRFFM